MEDTELSTEPIVGTAIGSAPREVENGQGSSTDYDSIGLLYFDLREQNLA